MPDPTEIERLIDPDCRDGKCGSCVGGPCEHHCHRTEAEKAEVAELRAKLADAERRILPAPERTPPDDTTREVVATDVGRRIRSLRERLSISQDTLALRLGCTQTAVSYWESGKRLIGLDDLLRVSGALGVTSSALLPDDTTVPVPADGPVLCLCGNPDNCTCPPAPARELRARLVAVIKSVRIHPKLDSAVTAMIMAGAGFHVTDDEAKPLADAIVAALAGDPGDLHKRMAAAIAAEWSKTAIVCEHTQLISFAPLAAAALSIRWAHSAWLAAENDYLRRRAEYAEGQLSALRDHETRWAAEHARADRAEIAANLGLHALQRAETTCRYHGDTPPNAPGWHGGCESCRQPTRVRQALAAIRALTTEENHG